MASKNKKRIFVYESFQTPNEVIDVICRLIPGSDFKILVAAIRLIFGWGKEKDRIAISRFQALTGLSRRAAQESTHRLMDLDLLIRLSDEDDQNHPDGPEYTINQRFEFTEEFLDKFKLTAEEKEEIRKELSGIITRRKRKEKKYKNTGEISAPPPGAKITPPPAENLHGESADTTPTMNNNNVQSDEHNNNNGKAYKYPDTPDPRVNTILEWYIETHPNYYQPASYPDDKKNIRNILAQIDKVFHSDDDQRDIETFKQLAGYFWKIKESWITTDNHCLRHMSRAWNKIMTERHKDAGDQGKTTKRTVTVISD